MKICPMCQQVYSDENLKFCRADGALLLNYSDSLLQEPTKPIGDTASGVETRFPILPDPVASPSSPTAPTLAQVSRRLNSRKAVNSLAILPLVNASNDADMEYLSDGITESIINALSQLPRLRVMARSTVFRYKDKNVDPQAVGQELGVRAVMAGRVQQIADKLIIKAELVDVADGAQLWGEHYQRKLADIFEIQEEIAQEITHKLRLKLTGEEKRLLAKRYTKNTKAYQLYLRGRYYWNKRTREGLKKGIAYFEQAIAEDPKYALAYAGLGDSYIVLGYYSFLSPGEAFEKARHAARRAVELDDTLAEAQTALAEVKLHYEWDWAGCEKAFKRALQLNPNYAHAHHWYSHYLVAMGRFDESYKESKKAEELDPLNLIIHAHLVWHHHYAGEYDEAIDYCQKTIEMEPDFGVAHFYVEPAYEQKAMYEEAIAEAEKALKLLGFCSEALGGLGHALAKCGRLDEAKKILTELKTAAPENYVSPYSIATIHIGLGEKEEALAWLEKAFAERASWVVYVKVDPRFAELHGEPKFLDLLQRLNLAK